MALNSRIIPLQSPDLVFKRASDDILVYTVFFLRINVKVKKKKYISQMSKEITRLIS